MDKRAKNASAFKMPLKVNMVNSIFCTDDTILLGCTVVDCMGPYPTNEQILELSMKSGKQITWYTIPDCSNSGFDRRICQLWGDNKYIVALTSTAVHVFDKYMWEEDKTPKTDEYTVNQIRSIVGPYDLQNAMFDALNERLMLTSKSRSPVWCYL